MLVFGLMGCFIAPFYGRLNPEKIFSFINSVSGYPSVQSVVTDKAVGEGDLMPS
jgi:hypothetical protein